MAALPYIYDLCYDIKTEEELEQEVNYLADRLGDIARMRREDGHSMDDYILNRLEIPKCSKYSGGSNDQDH